MQEERGPRKPKPPLTTQKRPTTLTPIATCSNFSPVHPQQELAAQILLVAIRQARFNSGFGMLDRVAQNEILGRLWAPLFLLRAAYWPIEVQHILEIARGSFKVLRQLQMDAYELEILENLLLCRPDLVSDCEQISLAQTMREKAVEALVEVR